VIGRAPLARHPLAIAGALIATASAVVFGALLIAVLTGLFDSPYAGLVVLVALPALLVLGLLLIPAGMWLQRRKLQRDPSAVAEWPVLDFRRVEVRRTALAFVALTAVNVVILLLAGYGSLHWMESPSFCGQVCHTPMHPQFTAWQGAAHAGVACTQCHIGEGAKGFVHAKLAGVRQLAHVMTGSFPRPVPSGVDMLPGSQAQACAHCHHPGRVAADRIRVIREYADDEGNSETLTVLQMHMGDAASSRRSIHWHADPAVQIEYVSTDADRQTIPYVKVTDAKGQVKEYVTGDVTEQMVTGGRRRVMECGDCHNGVGHPISPTPERAVDRAIAAGLVSRQLPFVRREGVRLLKASHSSEAEAAGVIDRQLRSFYQSRGGAIDQQAVAHAVAALQDLYRHNVFPTMKVTWGTYMDNKGHMTSSGCFRCHDDTHAAKDGSKISADCELCHKQIERPS
jgi:hypothetical protein